MHAMIIFFSGHEKLLNDGAKLPQKPPSVFPARCDQGTGYTFSLIHPEVRSAFPKNEPCLVPETLEDGSLL
jgi:hypothetical protein